MMAAQEVVAWLDGFELMRMLNADYYHVQPAGFWPTGALRGKALYKKGGVVLAELDAVELCGEDWLRGKTTWMVTPPSPEK